VSRWALLAVMWVYVEGLGLFALAVDAWLSWRERWAGEKGPHRERRRASHQGAPSYEVDRTARHL